MLDREFRIRPFAWIKKPWGLPVLFVAVFLCFILLTIVPWTAPSAPDWFQACGAILAILGAAAFPYMHERSRKREKAEGFRALFRLLTVQEHLDLGTLLDALNKAKDEADTSYVKHYIWQGWQTKWPPLLEALQAIPIEEVSPAQVFWLCEMKVIASFVVDLIPKLSNWDLSGEQEAYALERLTVFHIIVGDAVDIFGKQQV